MIDTNNLLRGLNQLLNDQQLQLVVRTMLREPLIGLALQDETVTKRLSALESADLEFWSPGNLALLLLDAGITADQIRDVPTNPLSPELRQRAVEFYEIYRNQNDRKINSLAEAGLIALALRERARILGSWEDLAQELPNRNNNDTRLVLACAYGYLPEPDTYMREYCQASKQLKICAAVVYLQPLNPEKQARIIASIAQAVRSSDRLELLLELQNSQPVDVQLLAHELLQYEQPSRVSDPNLSTKLWSIPEQVYFAEVYRLAGHSDRAVANYEQLGADLHALQIETTYRMISEAIKNKQYELIDRGADANDDQVKLPDDQMAVLAYQLYQAGQKERAELYLHAAEVTPAALILKVRYYADKLTKTEQLNYLLQAVSGWKNERRIPSDLMMECARMLLELGRPDQVMELARYLTDSNPDIAANHLLMAMAARLYGDYPTAIDSAQFAVALSPENQSAWRELIAAQQANNKWDEALAGYRRLLKLTPQNASQQIPAAPSDQQKQDFHNFSITAAQAGDTEQALQVCWKLLEKQPEDGKTYLFLGRIYSIIGELELASEHLLKANQLIPEDPDTWLFLAKVYATDGNNSAAENSLRTGVQALPDNPEIHLALGEFYYQQGQATQALNFLQKAANLDGLNIETDSSPGSAPESTYLQPRTAKIALLLGSTMLQLGHTEQAVHLLGAAYHTREHKQSAAYDYARSLLAVGQDRHALAALSVAYQTDPENSQLALEYARLLLKLGEQADVAVVLLQDLLAAGSEEIEIIGLLAEALAARNDFLSALEYYQKALESRLASDPRWSIRLALGLSHVAIATNTPNLAIAALQDAIQLAPEHLALHQKLAEACLAAGLEEDARHIARQAYQISPASVDNILWFTRQCQQLGEIDQAYQALSDAVELFPNNIGLHLELAQIEVRLGRQESAAKNYQLAAATPDISYNQLLLAAQGLMHMGRPDLAVSCLERIQNELLEKESSGNTQPLMVLLASGYAQMGKNEMALRLFDRALENQPESPALLKQKALIHLRMDQYQAAASCLKQVAHIDPIDSETHLLLVRTYEAQGDLQTALQSAHNALAYASEETFRQAVLEAARLSWFLFQQQDAAQYIASFTSSSKVQEAEELTLRHRLISGLIAIESQNWAFISELNQVNSSDTAADPIIKAIAALDDIQHGETEHASQFLQEVSGAGAELLEDIPIIYGLIIEIALQLSDYDQALKFARHWAELEKHNPRAYLSILRTLTEWKEHNKFLHEIGAIGHITIAQSDEEGFIRLEADSQHKLFELLGIPAEQQTKSLEINTILPEPVRRWSLRAQAVKTDPQTLSAEDQSRLLQELARLKPEPGNAAAYASAARNLQQVQQAMRAAREFPNHPLVLAQLAMSNLETDPSAAMAAALNALELAGAAPEKPLLPVFHTLVARAAASTENFQQAYRAIAHALADWPEEPLWQYEAAEYARLSGDLSACIQHLEKAVALHSDSIDYRRTLAEAYREAGAMNRAAESYQSLCGDFPQDQQSWLAFAELQLERGLVQDAAEAAEKALALDTSQDEVALFTAQLQLHAQNYSRAEQLASQIFEVSPQDPAAAYLLARSLSAANQREAALEVLDRALRYSDRPLDLYLERIRLVRALHGLQPAFQSLQALDRQHPDQPPVLALMAEYLQAQGLIQPALETAQRALQLGSENFNPAEKSRLHTLVGRILRRAGQLDQAVHQFVQAINLNPARVENYLELGKTYQDRKELDEALEVYQKAIVVAPDDPRPYQQAGQALKESKDYLGAEKMIRQAAELSPHDISIHRLLGSLVALNLVHNS